MSPIELHNHRMFYIRRDHLDLVEDAVRLSEQVAELKRRNRRMSTAVVVLGCLAAVQMVLAVFTGLL